MTSSSDSKKAHHHHGHDHHHHHHPGSEGRLTLAFWLNFAFALVELGGGIFANSFAVTSNALHDLGDSLAIALSLFLEKKSKQKSDQNFSYGYRRYSISAAFITSVFLVSGSTLVLYFGLIRLFNPGEPRSDIMIGLSILGILVNGSSLWVMKKGDSLNEKMLSWHFVEDTLSWVLVLVAGALIRYSGIAILDVILGLLVAVWILWNVQKSLRDVVKIFLQAVPKDLSADNIRQALVELPFVKDVHHLHLWTLDGEIHILTAHILLSQNPEFQKVPEHKTQIKKLLRQQFSIFEVTLEFEWPNENCEDPFHP